MALFGFGHAHQHRLAPLVALLLRQFSVHARALHFRPPVLLQRLNYFPLCRWLWHACYSKQGWYHASAQKLGLSGTQRWVDFTRELSASLSRRNAHEPGKRFSWFGPCRSARQRLFRLRSRHLAGGGFAVLLRPGR